MKDEPEGNELLEERVETEGQGQFFFNFRSEKMSFKKEGNSR